MARRECVPGTAASVGDQLRHLLRVGNRSFVAKYSLLGASLVSVVRGLRGTWPEVESRQRDYLADPGAQLVRECAQLQMVAACARQSGMRLRVPEVIACEAGVLITVAITANALDQMVTEHLTHHGPAALQRLMSLWLADWANYLATGLSLAPNAGLPLPLTLLAAAAQARPLLALATNIAAHLITDPAHAWDAALQGCSQLACAANGEHW